MLSEQSDFGRLPETREPVVPAYAVALLAGLFIVLEFGWKYAGPLERLKWPVSVPLWLLAIAVVVLPGRNQGLARRPLLMPFFGWLLWNELAVLWANKIPTSQVVTLSMVSTGLFGVWFAASFGWDWFCRVTVAVGATFEVLSLAAHALNYPHGIEGRMIGIGWGYSDTGIVAAFTTVMAVGLYRRRPFRAWPLGLLGLVTLLFAQARMSMVAAAVGVAIVLMHGASRARVLVARVALVTVLSLGAISVLGDSVLSSAISRNASSQDASSFTGRSLVWIAAIDQIAQTPWHGIGSKDNEDFFIAAAGRGDIQIPIFHAHNALLETMFETGLIGATLLVASFVAYACAVIAYRRRIVRRPGRDGCLMVFVFLGVTEALVSQGTLAVLIVGAALGSLSTDLIRRYPCIAGSAPPRSPVLTALGGQHGTVSA